MSTKGEKIALAAVLTFFFAVLLAVIIIGVIVVVAVVKNVSKVKDSITPEKFEIAMRKEGFDVEDITITSNTNAEKAYKADNGEYTVEFYSFKNNADADSYYEEKEVAVESKSASKKVSFSGKNYRIYTIIKSGAYTFIERINNTVVVVQGDSNHEKSSKKVLSIFGY